MAAFTDEKALKFIRGLFRRKADWQLCLERWEAEEKLERETYQLLVRRW